ncbi:MAG: hypothetical protein Q9167_003299 [Letrouitia subvulpina]
MESVKAMSPTMTGVSLVPITCIMLPVSMAVGFFMTKTGRFRWALWSGWIIMTLGNGLLILFDTHTATVKWVCIFVVLGLAHGLTLMPLIFGLQAMAETKDVAFAAAMYAFLRTFGQSVGVAIGGAVFQNLLAKHLKEANLPAAIATNAEGYVATLTNMPASDPIRLQIEQAFTLSFQGIFEVGVAISGFGLLCSLGVAHYSLDRHLGSAHLLTRTHAKNVAEADLSRGNSGDQLRE